MPVVIEYETVSGIRGTKKLPVEVWQNAVSIKTGIPVTEELKRVTIDPQKVFPDFNTDNNIWSGGK